MSRLLVRFSLVLIAASLWPAALPADEPSQLGSPPRSDANLPTTGGTASASLTKVGTGTLTLSGPVSPSNSVTLGAATGYGGTAIWSGTIATAINTYTGQTNVNAAVLDFNGACSNTYALAWGAGGASAPCIPSPTIPIPAGPVFYIVVEGAGLGDSVRSVPCTGKETVLGAVGAINGISSVSSGKLWIARPTAGKPDKSAILTVDWEAISKRGVETTNYNLMPGDRLVLAADPLTTQTNLAARRNGPIERASGIVSLTTSVIAGLKSTPSAAPVLKELVAKGFITDDEELKHIILDAIRAGEEGAKPDAKGAKPQPKDQSNEPRQEPNLGAGPTTLRVNGATLTFTGTMQMGAEEGKKPPVAKITAVDAPHELALRSLPDYRLEPPDVIQIHLLKEKKAEGGNPAVSGHYLIGPDGTINLRQFGCVHVAGMTVGEARTAIAKQLKQHLDSPDVAVDVVAYNSKVYYIVTQGAGLGDNVRRLPITGKETVLDAISQVNGLSQVSSRNITIVRPVSAGETMRLPIDWDGITQRGETATNYQIYPGDRVYIAEDPLMTMSNEMGKRTSPVERLMGIVGLVTNTVNCIDAAPNADEALKKLAEQGYLTNDEKLKQVILDAIRHRAAKAKAVSGKKE